MENMPRIQKRILSVRRLREGADVARLAIIGRDVSWSLPPSKKDIDAWIIKSSTLCKGEQ